ncbi:hypothetical protein ASD08_13590 [Streptomyces sp. Root369]|nr:hypothetical protein ASD08_13590 [Streptomyces sp. Root369]
MVDRLVRVSVAASVVALASSVARLAGRPEPVPLAAAWLVVPAPVAWQVVPVPVPVEWRVALVPAA